MSLIDFIQKIQKKPRYVRIQLLWASVFVCMLFVVSVWGFSFKHSLSIEDDNKKEDINISDDMVSLKDAFKASIGAFFEKEENNASPLAPPKVEAELLGLAWPRKQLQLADRLPPEVRLSSHARPNRGISQGSAEG